MPENVFVVVCWEEIDSATVIGLRTTWASAQELIRTHEKAEAELRPRKGKEVKIELIPPSPPDNRGRMSYVPGLDYDIYEMTVDA